MKERVIHFGSSGSLENVVIKKRLWLEDRQTRWEGRAEPGGRTANSSIAGVRHKMTRMSDGHKTEEWIQETTSQDAPWIRVT